MLSLITGRQASQNIRYPETNNRIVISAEITQNINSLFDIIIITCLVLESVDERQVVKCDVIVVILDVTKRFLMVLHQSVDLPILSLLPSKMI